MQIQLSQVIPKQDGYYLVKFNARGGLHLVLIQTELDGKKTIISDTGKKLFINDFPTRAYWSELISCVI